MTTVPARTAIGANFLLTLLLPLGFLTRYGLLGAFAGLCLAFLAVIYARVRLVRALAMSLALTPTVQKMPRMCARSNGA